MIIFNIEVIIALIVALLLGFGLGLLYNLKKVSTSKKEVEKIKRDAIKEAEAIKKEAEIEAKDFIFKAKTEIEQENKDKKYELINFEKRLLQKEDHLDKKVEQIDRRESEIFKREKNLSLSEKQIQQTEKKYDEMIIELKNKLESVAHLTQEEAKNLLLKEIEDEARHDAAKLIKLIEEETKEIADKKAKEIISLAIQRYAGDYVAEKTVSYVNLPNEEMKGRIIGREGRNIKAIEAATGVDLIIDDTPEAVILSSHNPIRREVARLSLEKLISDGRIHPARIEEVVEKVKIEVEEAIKEAGEQATFDLGVHGIHPELIKLIGKLKYRTSYAQNILKHSIEVGFLCGIMAAELGLNIKQARRAGLLHDIGKAVDHEVEGSHALIGAELAKKYNESFKIIKAIAAHHYEEEPDSPLAVLVAAADALSAARPGARREAFETYVKRIEELEQVALSFKGVEKSYAIQAGREIRIIVESREVLDSEIALLSNNIAKKIEKDLNYPGQIKVTVIRETRAVDYAR